MTSDEDQADVIADLVVRIYTLHEIALAEAAVYQDCAMALCSTLRLHGHLPHLMEKIYTGMTSRKPRRSFTL
jgi:hypothetical protein